MNHSPKASRTKMKLLLLCFSLPLFATTKIEFIESTQSQAKVLFTTSSGITPCSIRASRGTTLGTQIPDLADNGATEPHTGWIVNGSQHTIILGSRKANDALAANGTYIVGVTCLPDAEVTQVFQTKPIQWGNTAPDIVPFNNAKFGNMDHPAIDWNGTGTVGVIQAAIRMLIPIPELSTGWFRIRDRLARVYNSRNTQGHGTARPSMSREQSGRRRLTSVPTVPLSRLAVAAHPIQFSFR